MPTSRSYGKVDLDAQRRQKEEADAERGSGVAYFKPQAGKNLLRLLPPHPNSRGLVIVKGGTHWGVAEYGISCPVAAKKAKSCWLCDRADELMASPDKKDVAEGKNLRYRTTFRANVIDLNNVD